MHAGEVASMLVFHVDDSKIACTEVTEAVFSALNHKFPAKHLRQVEW